MYAIRSYYVLVNSWKFIGYNSIIYFAAISTIDPNLYEAAVIDGAGRVRQILSVTLPSITPHMIIMILLGISNIFRADFGLFYNVPKHSGALYEVTQVIDTYVYIGLIV